MEIKCWNLFNFSSYWSTFCNMLQRSHVCKNRATWISHFIKIHCEFLEETPFKWRSSRIIDTCTTIFNSLLWLNKSGLSLWAKRINISCMSILKQIYDNPQFDFLSISNCLGNAKDSDSFMLALAILLADGRAFTPSAPLRRAPVVLPPLTDPPCPLPRRALPCPLPPFSLFLLLFIISSRDISKEAMKYAGQ